MILFKACPRCRGELYHAEDIWGKYISCLQCGYSKDLDDNFRVLESLPKVKDTEVMYVDSLEQDKQWLEQNRQIAELLAKDLPTSVISQKVKKSERSVRAIRAKLHLLQTGA